MIPIRFVLLLLRTISSTLACAATRNTEPPTADPCASTGCPTSGRPSQATNTIPDFNNLALTTTVNSCTSLTFTCTNTSASQIAITITVAWDEPPTDAFCMSTSGGTCSATFSCSNGLWSGRALLTGDTQVVHQLHCLAMTAETTAEVCIANNVGCGGLAFCPSSQFISCSDDVAVCYALPGGTLDWTTITDDVAAFNNVVEFQCSGGVGMCVCATDGSCYVDNGVCKAMAGSTNGLTVDLEPACINGVCNVYANLRCGPTGAGLMRVSGSGPMSFTSGEQLDPNTGDDCDIGGCFNYLMVASIGCNGCPVGITCNTGG